MNGAPLWALLVLAIGACDNYDPCGDKACGEPCTLCAPEDADCEESAVSKVCNRNEVCTSAQPPLCG